MDSCKPFKHKEIFQIGAVCAGGKHVCDGQGSVCPGNTEDINCPGTFLCSDNKWQVREICKLC